MIQESGSIPPTKLKGAPLSCKKGKVFEGGKGAETGNNQQRTHCFRQGHPPKGNGRNGAGGLPH